MGILSDLLGGIAKDLYGGLPQEVKGIYTDELTQLTSPDITFQPFTVTGPTGAQTGVTRDPITGQLGMQYTLDPTELALQDDLLAQSQAMLTGAVGDRATREQDIYDTIRATQLGEEERQRLALEERLASQGRLGVQTAMFGGTPEQLALAQAQEEAQARASLAAIEQARAEQMQQAGLSEQFLQQAYTPQAAMLSALSPALNIASLEDVARRQQGEFDYQTQLANLQGAVGQSQGLADLYAGMFAGAGGLLSGLTAAVPGTLDAVANIKNAFFPSSIPSSSDINLKDNIKRVGKLPNGLSTYTWNWTEEAKEIVGNQPSYGVIAQEVQQVLPEAVIRQSNGYLAVDYSKIL
jgi:hypothetical protein